jgi:uncharacterized protein YbjT (DUF2867 family)
MNVFLTGATGFTGSRTLPLLLERGLRPRCLYRAETRIADLPRAGVEWVRGDLGDPQGLASAMQGCDALLNLASLGFGHAPGILDAAGRAGVQRALFISTTAIFTRLNARSKRLRLEAEAAIHASGLDWTILRPTMIYGSPRDRNMWRLVRWLRVLPLLPIFGDGCSLQQPVYVDDVARAAVDALLSPNTIRKCYNIAGKEPQPYNEIVDTIAARLNRRVWKLHIPARPVIALLGALGKTGLPLPIKAEQVERLNEDKAFDYAQAAADFGYAPRSFAEGIRLEISPI